MGTPLDHAVTVKIACMSSSINSFALSVGQNESVIIIHMPVNVPFPPLSLCLYAFSILQYAHPHMVQCR